jgi:hypothetical protein
MTCLQVSSVLLFLGTLLCVAFSSSYATSWQEYSYVDDVSLVRGVLYLDTSFTYNMSYDLVQLPVLAEAARKSLIFSIHNNTQLDVSSGAGVLDLARVQVKSITRGSVIIDMSFLAPEGTTAGQLDALGTAIHQQPEAYMAGPFTTSFGPSVILSASAATALPGSWLTASSWGGIFAGCLAMLLLVPPIGFGIYLLWDIVAKPRLFFYFFYIALPLATAFRPVTLWICKVAGPYWPCIQVAYIRVVNGIKHARHITWWSDAVLPLRFIVTKHWNDYPVGHHRYDPDDDERRATCGFSWPARHVPNQYYIHTHQQELHSMMPHHELPLEGLVEIQPSSSSSVSSSVPHTVTAAPPTPVPHITILPSSAPTPCLTSPSSSRAAPYTVPYTSPRAAAKPLPVLMRTSQCGSQDPVRESYSIQGTSQGIIQATGSRHSTEEQPQAAIAIEPRPKPDNHMQWVEKLPVEQPLPEIRPVGGDGTIAYITSLRRAAAY